MSGSGKKHMNKGPLWFDCSKCKKRFLRQHLTKHHELDCVISYPFMDGTGVFINLNEISKSSPSEIRSLPFLNNTRHISEIIFVAHSLILECSLEAYGWVTATAIGKDANGALIELDSCQSYALMVWPIFDPPSKQPHVSLMSEIGLKVNSQLNTKSDELCCVKLKKLNFLTSLPIFLSAGEITVQIEDTSSIQGINFEMERFVQVVRGVILGRKICKGNRFQVRIFIEMIPIIVTNIRAAESISPSGIIDVANEFSSLQICERTEQTVTDFYEITDSTVINVIESDSLKDNSAPGITLLDVGGLDSVIKDITSTINFLFSSALGSAIPRGLLLYGNTGTGKSLLAEALCSHYKLRPIFFDGMAKGKIGNLSSVRNSLTAAVREAILRAPAAVIIENIDAYGSKKQNSSLQQGENLNFESTLLSSIESIPATSKVILLATTSDIDSVDSNLRSLRIFAKEIEITIPSSPEREDILNKLIRNVKHSLSSQDIKSISDITHGFVGADLKGLCSQATMLAAQKHLESRSIEDAGLDVKEIFVTLKDFQECVKWVKPSAMRSILVDIPNVRWSDIGGQADLKFKLKQAIEWPLKHPEAFQRLGIKPPKGILMYGPPGCSKTMIAKAIATESGLNFISVKGSELFSKWVGESEKAVQTLFRKARQVSPSVVFFDEIDSLGGERGSSSGSSNVHERVLAQLLVEIDGIVPLKDVTIVAATNRPDIIDPALLRPGRLDRIIYVPMPDDETREEILKVRFKKMPVDSQVNLKRLVQLTDGYSGAEVTAVCHEAALKALEENIKATIISDKHFLSALEIVRPRISAEQISFYENYYKSRKM